MQREVIILESGGHVLLFQEFMTHIPTASPTTFSHMINSITFINTLSAKPSASQTSILLGATPSYPCGYDVSIIHTFSLAQLRESGTPMRTLNSIHPFTSQPSDTKHLGSGKRQWDGFHQLLLNPDTQLQAWGTNAYFL